MPVPIPGNGTMRRSVFLYCPTCDKAGSEHVLSEYELIKGICNACGNLLPEEVPMRPAR